MVTNAVSITGDSVNLENYAKILKKYYGIESLIAYNASDVNNSSMRIREIRSHGILVEAVVKESDLVSISKNFQATHGYFVIDGHFFPRWIPGVKHLNHAVFRYFEPYGDKYAYVSEWLHKYANRKRISRTESELKKIYAVSDTPHRVTQGMQTGWVPHTVLPKFESGHEFRTKHTIANDVFLVGRIGGFKKFSDPEAKKAVCEILENHKDIVFCFINTEKFINHKNAIFLDEIDEFEKWKFYGACNLLLNCRISGESFGFSIVEPLMLNKPVIAPSILRNRLMDQNQISILKHQGLLYHSRAHLKYLILKHKKHYYSSKVYNFQQFSQLVEQYNAESVAEKFVEYFLDSEVPKLSL